MAILRRADAPDDQADSTVPFLDKVVKDVIADRPFNVRLWLPSSSRVAGLVELNHGCRTPDIGSLTRDLRSRLRWWERLVQGADKRLERAHTRRMIRP